MRKESNISKGRFGIIVSGGPAPGINCVIASTVIEAHNNGYETIGFRDGFRAVCNNEENALVPLTLNSISGIYNTGGSILGTTRHHPFVNDENKNNFVEALKAHNIDKLVIIGGEGSAFVSYQLSKQMPDIQVVHVPKTIDNDLILPNNYPSFGFETARYAGTKIIDTLMVDAKTSRRWFLVTSMGRKAGFLALGLGVAAGATLTLIPEEYPVNSSTPSQIAGTIFSSINRRAKAGKFYGVAIMAEGLLDCLAPDSSPLIENCPRDELGRIRYSQIELGDVILPALKSLINNAGLDIKLIPKNIGYELRCHSPVSYDIEYTKFLAYGAVKFLLEGKTGIMITRDFDELGFKTLESMIGDDGLIKSRTVDLESDLYTVSRTFMIR
jgi:6-phosphofructokinase